MGFNRTAIIDNNSSYFNFSIRLYEFVVVIGALIACGSLYAANDIAYAAVVKAGKTALLSSQLEGLVTEVHVKPGDSFHEGDTLLSMDCSLPEAALSKAKAELEFARNEYKSTKALKELNSTTTVQVARSAAQFAMADADVQTAQYQVDRCVLTAPFDGTVIQSWINPHESVQLKKELLKIVSNTELSVEFLAPSNQLAELREGRLIRLSIMETGADYELSIDKVIPVVDSVSQTVKVVSHIAGDDGQLWSGMSGRVSLVTEVAMGDHP